MVKQSGKRTTYLELLSPFAQIEAAEDFIGQMEAMVADTWRERETPEDTARAESPSAEEFLFDLREGALVVRLLRVLNACGLRFESDGEENEDGTGGGEGFFRWKQRPGNLNFALHFKAFTFHLKAVEFAPEGWAWLDTTECLGWENLVIVPDEHGAIAQALDLVVAKPEEDEAIMAFIQRHHR